MTEDQAQKIVYAFIDVLSLSAAMVCDADRLPYPKETIKEAFRIVLGGYENMRALSEETFRDMGYEKELSNLSAMSVRVDDFKIIAPEDKAAIASLVTKSMPTEDTMRAMLKYMEL